MFLTGRLPLVASSIIVGGVLLGSALATFARPVPIEPQPAPWQGMLHPAIQASEYQPYPISYPEDLSPPDSYAPPIAFTTLKWWPADLRLPRTPDYVPPPEPRLVVPQYVPDDTLTTDREVQIPHYAAIEQTAQQAQDAAKDAATAQQAPPPAGDAPVDDAKIIQVADQLAQAG